MALRATYFQAILLRDPVESKSPTLSNNLCMFEV